MIIDKLVKNLVDIYTSRLMSGHSVPTISRGSLLP
jgi:hypothetical protein